MQEFNYLAVALAGSIIGVVCSVAAFRVYSIYVGLPPGFDRRPSFFLTLLVLILVGSLAGCVVGLVCAGRWWNKSK